MTYRAGRQRTADLADLEVADGFGRRERGRFPRYRGDLAPRRRAPGSSSPTVKGNWKDRCQRPRRASPTAAAAWTSWTSTRTASWTSPIARPLQGRVRLSRRRQGQLARSASSGLPTIGAEDVAMGDFNNDGCADLASVAAAEEGVRAFIGNCKGVWKESSNGPGADRLGQRRQDRVDVNGDGNLDVVAAYAAGPRVWLAATARAAGPEASQESAGPGDPRPVLGYRRRRSSMATAASTSSPARRCRRCREAAGARRTGRARGGGVEAFLQADPRVAGSPPTDGFLPMNALRRRASAISTTTASPTWSRSASARSIESAACYGVYVYLGRRHRQVDAGGAGRTCRRPVKNASWGVGIGGRRQGRRDATSPLPSRRRRVSAQLARRARAEDQDAEHARPATRRPLRRSAASSVRSPCGARGSDRKLARERRTTASPASGVRPSRVALRARLPPR